MKFKRFVAPDTCSEMQQIKVALGPDGVNLSSSRIEIVAAIEYLMEQFSNQDMGLNRMDGTKAPQVVAGRFYVEG